ncbi:hypothetical protein CesoFtcFv8_026593 [Champsocephalus esox]|uniref:Uncharacterized protein n=1 Tax=Champsocephalus esox TaxID=159716 RepID=A0AAN8AZE9_9TELE|nr:hypothetical protein CesoFtcFv8_026593 [Champsocephalus esox]
MRKAAQDLLAILKAEASGGLFLDYSGQTKTSDPFPKVQRKNQALKLFVFHSSSSEKTPKPSEELILLRAGLGRRSAHVPEDADHKEVACPVCGELFSQAVINIHAEFCGVTEESVINEEVPEPSTTDRTGSLSDLLDNLKGKIDNSKMFKINVTREDLLQRGLK